MRCRRSSLSFGLPLRLSVLLVCSAAPALAQEPINADSATQPSPGHVTIKEQLRFMSLDMDSGAKRDRGAVRDLLLEAVSKLS